MPTPQHDGANFASFAAAGPVTTVTHDGVALTQVKVAENDVNGYVRVELWRLVAPASGIKTISINGVRNWDHAVQAGSQNTVLLVALILDAALGGNLAAMSNSYADVDQATPLGTPVAATGENANPLANVPGTAIDGMVYDVVGFQGTDTLLVGPGQQLRNGPQQSGNDRGYVSEEPGNGGTVEMDWDVTGGLSRVWAMVAVELKAVAVAATKQVVELSGSLGPARADGAIGLVSMGGGVGPARASGEVEGPLRLSGSTGPTKQTGVVREQPG